MIVEQGIVQYSVTAVGDKKYNLTFIMNKSVFSPEEDERLLEKIKKYDILFDSKNKNYKNTESKNDIWKAISRDLGKTVDETKKRWKNIRDSYFRNKRKLGTRSAAARRTKWHLKSHLSFLDTVVHERSTTSTVSETKFLKDEDRTQEESTEDKDLSQNEAEKESATVRSSEKRTRKKRMSSILEKKSKQRQAAVKFLTSQNNKRDDDVDLFCRSIAMSIKELPKRGQNEAKLKILGVVAELEEKYNFHSPRSIPVVSSESDLSSLLSPTTVHSNSSGSDNYLYLEN